MTARRLLVAVFGVLVALGPTPASAIGSLPLASAPIPVPTATSAPTLNGTTTTDLQTAQQRQAVIEQVRQQLGSTLAASLQAEEQISESLQDNAIQQQTLRDSIADSNDKIDTLTSQVAQLDIRITSTESRIYTERAQIIALARAIYAQPTSLLLLIVESPNLGAMITRVNDLRSAGVRAQALKSHLKSDLATVDRQRSDQEAARIEQTRLHDAMTVDLGTLKDLHDKQVKAEADLTSKIAETRAELSSVDRQSVGLARQIADLLQKQQEEIIAAALEAVWDQVQTIHPVGLPTDTSKGHSQKYRFVWPMPKSTETQPYGPCDFWFEPPYNGFPHFHTGIDMSGPIGDPVYAADDGVVILAGASIVNGQLVGYGNYVVIAHSGGLTTLYGHLQKLLVKVGDGVSQGTPIGLEGSTGNSTGAHLHFELRVNGAPTDPAPYLPPGAPSDFKG